MSYSAYMYVPYMHTFQEGHKLLVPRLLALVRREDEIQVVAVLNDHSIMAPNTEHIPWWCEMLFAQRHSGILPLLRQPSSFPLEHQLIDTFLYEILLLSAVGKVNGLEIVPGLSMIRVGLRQESS
jgi:hypothetical protein